MLGVKVPRILKTKMFEIVRIFAPRHVGGIPESETLVEDVPESLSKPTRRYKKGEERIEAIRQEAADGLSIDAIAEQEGISISTVERYFRQRGIRLPGKKSPSKERIEEIIQAADGGLEYIEDVASQLRLAESTVIGYLPKAGIKLKHRPKAYVGEAKSGSRITRKPEIDKLIQEGRTLAYMGEIDGTTRENIRQYLKVTGQDKEWKVYRQAAREAKKQDRQFEKQEKSQLLEGLVSIMDNRVRALAQEEGFAVQKAVQYIQSLRSAKSAKYSHESLITIFERYEDAMSNGEKLSLAQLGQGFGVFPSAIGRILNRAGLEPMHGSRGRIRTSYENMEAVQRAHGLEMSGQDIAYFLDVPYNIARQGFENGRRPRMNTYLSNFERVNLTYRLTSKIYGAQDDGSNPNKIAQLFDIDGDVVSHVLNNRSIGENYEKKIVDVLRIMLDDNTISKPYLERSKG